MTSIFSLCMNHQITQLHFGLQHHHCVILTGPSGSSKTTCLRTLAAAYHHLGEVRAMRRQTAEGDVGEKGYPSSVNIVVINPAAHTEEEVGIWCVVECNQVCVCTLDYLTHTHVHSCLARIR